MYHYLYILLIAVFSSCCFSMDLPGNKIIALKESHIIFLNGTTTAGKSSIATELKRKLEAKSLPVEICSIDTFLVPKIQWALVQNRLNPWNMFVPNDQLISFESMQEIRNASQQELCTAVRAAYAQKKIVIIDTPAYCSEQIMSYQKSFADLDVTWILVYCPVSTLVDRVIKRNQAAGITGQRSVAQALDQFTHLYSNNQSNFIDTLSPATLFLTCEHANTAHITMQNEIPGFLKGIQQIICPSSIEDIKNVMRGKFRLTDNTQIINIAPDIQLGIEYSAIVDTNLYDPLMCAKSISDIFR